MFQPLSRYADFQGRARRSEYWLWFLFQVIAEIVFSIVESAAGGTNASAGSLVKLVEAIFKLAILIPTLAVAVRRFHDIGRTGWWVLFPFAVTVVALVVFLIFNGSQFIASMSSIEGLADKADTPEGALALLSAFGPMLLWVFVPAILASLVTFVFHVLDGTPGRNRFGPDPKGRGQANASVF
jgi:uncharacterized membrane protein YhaH (DUF805 family)